MSMGGSTSVGVGASMPSASIAAVAERRHIHDLMLRCDWQWWAIGFGVVCCACCLLLSVLHAKGPPSLAWAVWAGDELKPETKTRTRMRIWKCEVPPAPLA